MGIKIIVNVAIPIGIFRSERVKEYCTLLKFFFIDVQFYNLNLNRNYKTLQIQIYSYFFYFLLWLHWKINLIFITLENALNIVKQKGKILLEYKINSSTDLGKEIDTR